MNCRECEKKIDNNDLKAEVNESDQDTVEVFIHCRKCGFLVSAFLMESEFHAVD